ncbi:hypothetical protein L1049_024625 [Liquidambar formosana]|uniref:Uncharacterized protein n=1 Tax=Liquidambar formosana TaxID=63359 RepID=A0AAP0RVH7_LIQFO
MTSSFASPFSIIVLDDFVQKAEPLRSPPKMRLFTPYGPSSRRYITVTESTVYRLEPSQDLENPNASIVVGEGSSSSSKGILVEVKAKGPNVKVSEEPQLIGASVLRNLQNL